MVIYWLIWSMHTVWWHSLGFEINHLGFKVKYSLYTHFFFNFPDLKRANNVSDVVIEPSDVISIDF